jgi:arylamine N-acetyltransferase
MEHDIEERKRLFRLARDIPFRTALSIQDQGYACVAKPEILDRMLQTLGLESRHIICKFNWEDLGVPDDVLEHDHETPETHEYLEVYLPEEDKWVKVDPNWDSKIQHPEIPIAEWDGKTDTKLAVKPVETLSPEESKEFIEQDSTKEARKDYFKRNREFFKAMNQWLESLRKGTQK